MIKRSFWLNLIEKYWQQRSVIWLKGVRRSGKTCLCQQIPNAEYFDCELPRVRRQMDDPQGFLEQLNEKKIVLDEIHRLDRPAELLKIAADYFPKIKIIATGSSVLGASTKFKDTLTGRKRELHLTPMISDDLVDFKMQGLDKRLLFGGLPPFILSKSLPETDYAEWCDSFWSKDIQDLFRLQKRNSFQKFLELLLMQSGGIFEATKFARVCEISRITVIEYLKILELTSFVQVVRPFSTYKATEIVAAPKVYGFDTGFVSYFKGFSVLRQEDKGLLWEHYVLNELLAKLPEQMINYWRDKQGHEIDFVLQKRNKKLYAIECKWSADDVQLNSVASFLSKYADAEVYVVAQNIDRAYQKSGVNFVNLYTLINKLKRS